jgi:hypothetical protein
MLIRICDLTCATGLLREARQGGGRVHELDGMGCRNTGKAGRTSAHYIIFFAPLKDVPFCQTPWEGGVFKLVMLFPEGTPPVLETESS